MTEAEWIAFLQRLEIAAFNRAMLANPDDDLPRLVFADWLDENCPDHRVGAHIRESVAGRSRTVHFLPVPSEVSVFAERGRLVLSLRADSPPIEFVHRTIWESGWVGGIRLRNSTPDVLTGWVTHPQMAGVEGLEVNDGGEEVTDVLILSDHLTALRHLNLSMCRLGDAVWLLTLTNFPALRALTLFDAGLDDAAAAEIAGALTFAPLIKIDLANNRIGPAGARALADSPHLTRMQALRLSHNPIGDEGVVAVAGSSALAGLLSLNLESTSIGLAGVQALCRSPHLRNLTTLEIGHNTLGLDAVEDLAACPHLTGLTTLKISGTHMGEAGARALAASPHLHNLRSLNLSYNPIGDGGLAALADSPLFDRLDQLSLGTCDITVAGLRALANAPRFADPRPLQLSLTGNNFGELVTAEVDAFPPTLAAAVRNAELWAIDMR